MTTVWRIGRFEGDAASWPAVLSESFPGVAVRSFPSPAVALAADAPPPDIVLIAQHRPREFAPRDIDGLLGAHPLARFVCGLGPWCASDGRSQRAWPDGVAVPWHAVPARLRREADVLAGRRDPLPVTAGRDEAAVFDFDAEDIILPAASVGVFSHDRPLAALVCEAITAAGGHPVRLPATEAVSAAVWDADPLGEESFARLGTFRAAEPRCPVVALTALPTVTDVRRLRLAGADRVLAKPFDVSELLAALAGVGT